MVSLIYKAYYIFFLHYSRSKMEVAWFSSIIAISASFMVMLISFSNEVGLLEKIYAYWAGDTALAIRINIMLYLVIPLCVSIGFVVHYIVFSKVKASKKTGLSELYPFTPTRCDKVTLWVVWIGSFVLSFAPSIIRKLMEGS